MQLCLNYVCSGFLVIYCELCSPGQVIDWWRAKEAGRETTEGRLLTSCVHPARPVGGSLQPIKTLTPILPIAPLHTHFLTHALTNNPLDSISNPGVGFNMTCGLADGTMNDVYPEPGILRFWIGTVSLNHICHIWICLLCIWLVDVQVTEWTLIHLKWPFLRVRVIVYWLYVIFWL